MKKPSDKNKKILIVSLLGGVCIVLIISILTHFKTPAVKETTIVPPSSSSSSEVSTSFNISSQEEEKAVSAQPKQQSSATVSASSTTPTNQPVQNLQSKVSKPKQPTESEIKNPSKKPSNTSSVASKAEQGGETKNGQVYLPGFGWVDNNGGGGEGTTVSDMYENGNKIADMN